MLGWHGRQKKRGRQTPVNAQEKCRKRLRQFAELVVAMRPIVRLPVQMGDQTQTIVWRLGDQIPASWS